MTLTAPNMSQPDQTSLPSAATAIPDDSPVISKRSGVRKRSGTGGETVVMAATAAISGLNYLYTIVMIWLLPPTQYVVVGSVSALLLIFGTVAGASVPWVLAREVATSGADVEKRRRAASFAVGATLAQAVAAAVATCLVADRYSAPPALVISFVAVIFIFAASTAAGYLQGQLRFGLLAGLRVSEVLIKIATGVLLVLAGHGSAGAIAGFAFGAAAVAAVAGACMAPDLRWVRGALFDRRLWSDTFGLLSIQGGVAVLASLDVVLASLVVGTSTELATYQAANILGRVPLFIGAALSIVVFPRLAVFVGRRAADIRDSLRLFARVCIPGAAVVMTAPGTVVGHLFPHSYGNVASVLPWAALAGLGVGLANLSTTYFQAAGIIKRTTLTLVAGIVAGGALDYVGLRVAGARGLAFAVALQGLAVSASLLRDCSRTWSGSLQSLGRTVVVSILLTAPLFLVHSSTVLWGAAVIVFGVVPVIHALHRANLRGGAGDRPRVLHLGYEDPRRPGAGGGSVRTHEINRRLVRDYDVTVVCAAYPGCRTRIENGVRYTHIGIRKGPWISLLSYFATIPLALWRNPSDLVIEDFGAPFSSIAVPWFTHRPVIGVVQWLFAEQKWKQYRIPFHLIERLGVRAQRKMIAVSGELGGILADRNHRAEVAVVPNGLDANAFATDRVPREPRRGIAYLGRIEIAQKGLDLLLNAYALVADEIEQDLHIGGDGPDRQALEQLAESLGISKRIHFAGRIEARDRFGWLAGAELLAMPSRYETFGMVAAEALAVETPVVAFDIPCLREVVGDRAGLLVPAFDTGRYAMALGALATDATRARSLGREGPGQVAGLRWDALARQQGCLYRAALDGQPFELPPVDPKPPYLDGVAPIDAGDPVAMTVATTAPRDGTTRPEPPPAADVIDLFHYQVDTNSDAVAVDDGTRRYRYVELGAMVADLAERITASGAAPGTTVAVCLPRSIEAIVALLGILEAGCVYLPLDPAWPHARRESMCQQAGVAAVIGPAECTALLPGAGLELSCPPRVATGLSVRAEAARSEADPEAAAYIIFTSGTTGMPKGVQVSRANLAAFLVNLCRDYTPDELAVTATSTSFTFDPHLIEVLGPLAVGGCVRVIPDAFALRDVEPGITMMATTPSVAGELLRRGWLPPTLRTLVVGGEVLSPGLAQEFLALPHLRRLVNAYGPTEATVQVSNYDVTLPACQPIPLGKPAVGTDVVVVDEELRPVPDGEIGELVITGAQVAMGYAGDPGLSAAKFISLPRGVHGSVRAYRTGDLGRRRLDATLEYCGRIDRQVKVRGFRVEPGEIETALGRLESVSQAAVRAVGTGSDALLVAYVVPATSGPFDARLARRELRTTLADYLIPSRFVTLDALPLTPQGKLDERALAEVSSQRERAETETITASGQTTGGTSLTAAEATVAELVRQLLDVPRPIEAGDDFLDDLGGTSLGMIGLLAAMETEFACRLSIRQALKDTTIQGLAALVDSGTHRQARPVPLTAPSGNDGRAPLFLINPYVGSVLRQRRLGAHLPEGCEVISVDVHDAGADFAAGPLSIVDLAEHALVQIRAAQPHGPYCLGGHSAGGLIALEAAQRLLASGEEVAGLLLIDSPVTRTRLDYIWGEFVMNWPEFRAGSSKDRRSALRSLIRSRWSVHRRGPRREASALVDGVELATRRTNIATKVYRPSAYPGAATLLWTDQGLRMARRRTALGWDRLIRGPLTSRQIGGDHNAIFDPEHITGLSEEIGRFVEATAPELDDSDRCIEEPTSWLHRDGAELVFRP